MTVTGGLNKGKGVEMRPKKRFESLLGLVAIAGISLGLNISWTPDATLVGEVVLPAAAGEQDNDRSNAKDDDDRSNAKDDDGPSTQVEKAHCGRHDSPETGLQGQIPMPDRLAG